MSDPGTLRRPNEAESRVMSRRGWWLVVLNFLVPGLPQLVAGNRVLARIGLWFWALSWVAGLWALWALWSLLAGRIRHGHPEPAEKLQHLLVHATGHVARADFFKRADIHHRRADLLHQIGEIG